MQGPHYSSPSYPPRFLRRNHIEDNAEDDGILRRCWDTYAMINALVRNYSYSQEIKMSQSFKDLIIMARLILNFFYKDFDSMFTMLNKRNILYILQNFQLAALADIECGMGIIFRAPLVIVAPRSLEQKTNLRK